MAASDSSTSTTAAGAPARSHGQFALLGQRRFGPFFATQFIGAANDNVFKYAFTLLVTYHAAQFTTLDPALAGLATDRRQQLVQALEQWLDRALAPLAALRRIDAAAAEAAARGRARRCRARYRS